MRLVSIIVLLFVMNGLYAWTPMPKNEFSIFAGCGIPLDLSNSSSVKGFSGSVGVGYTKFLNRLIGVHIGVGLGLNHIQTNVDSLSTITHGLFDEHNYRYDLYTTLYNYEETKKTSFLSIPIMLQFQQNLGEERYFYAMGGITILFQHQTDFKAKVSELYNLAYYPLFDNWAGTQNFVNLGTFGGNNTNGNFNLELFTKLAFETGLKWRISDNAFLYAGAFLDYNLNDPARKQRRPYGEFISPDHLSDLTLLTFADKLNLMTVGVKFRLAFSLPFKPRIKPQPIPKIPKIPCSSFQL
jgi:hypothetical protein